MQTTGDISKVPKDIAQRVKNAARLGNRFLMQSAAVVIMTLAVATQPGFNIFRNAHAVMLEEAEHANCLDTMVMASHYPFAHVHMLVGCWLSLPPMVSGAASENPFQSQLRLSLLAMLHATGFPVARLQETSRFANDELLRLCRYANRMPELAMVSGSARPEESEKTRKAMNAIWKKQEVVILLHIEDSSPVTANNSTLNIPMAVTGMHHLEHFVELVEGKDVMYICAYNAQLNLVKQMAEHLVQGLRQENKHTLVDRISCVEFMTIDSSMGKDRKHTIVDYSGSDGFFFEDPRTLIALSRAKVSTLIIADMFQLAPHNKVRRGHAFRDVADYLSDSNAIVKVCKRDRIAWRRYDNVMKSLGLGLGTTN